MSQPTLSRFAAGLRSETAFDVLAVAKRLKATGKDVIELQIGDSPFPSTASALRAGKEAIDQGKTHYCPSPGLPEFREAIAENYGKEFGVSITADNVVVAPGAKVFEQFFCEVFLEPGDSVLVFSPEFPTYEPNISRRGAAIVRAALRQENSFRPDPKDVEQFLTTATCPKAIFLNTPHNPTGGVATEEDLQDIAGLIRGKDVALFSDEPYCHMIWEGRHFTPLREPGMLDQCVAAYTFSKSYSMSGWRVGYSVSSIEIAKILSKMINTSLSCVPPITQLAAKEALIHDSDERDAVMDKFKTKVNLLTAELRKVPDIEVLDPVSTFYAFPNVSKICDRLGITSHGLAMFLLEGADDGKGVACLGGECFGQAGAGFIRFSCAEPDERLVEAVGFLRDAIGRGDRVKQYLQAHPEYASTE